MPVPEPLPMLRPFQEAVAYQLQREPMDADAFYDLDDEARRRAFTIAGLTRQSSLIEAHRLATAAIAAGRTKQEFLEELGDLLDTEGTILPRPRLSLIAQNNTAAAYSAGRWMQLADPELAQLRPYLQYPLGPSDERTSAICRRLEGFIARHDHPVWQRIFPPNHHNERHIQVTSLTEEQGRGTGRVYEGLDTDDYPFVDGQRILPDPGFDAPPQLLTTDGQDLVARAAAGGAPVPARDASYYGLGPLAEVPKQSLPKAPRDAMRELIDVDDAASYDRAWEAFRASTGIRDGESSSIILDVFGDGVRPTRESFEHIVGIRGSHEERQQKRDRGRFFSYIQPAISDPFEVWLVPQRRQDGEMYWTRRYIALFDAGAKPRKFVVFTVSQEGWLMESANVRRDVEDLRQGLLLMTKGRRS